MRPLAKVLFRAASGKPIEELPEERGASRGRGLEQARDRMQLGRELVFLDHQSERLRRDAAAAELDLSTL